MALAVLTDSKRPLALPLLLLLLLLSREKGLSKRVSDGIRKSTAVVESTASRPVKGVVVLVLVGVGGVRGMKPRTISGSGLTVFCCSGGLVLKGSLAKLLIEPRWVVAEGAYLVPQGLLLSGRYSGEKDRLEISSGDAVKSDCS